MAEFNVRSDSVDVDEIMQQIRQRIREKRGVDYTEEEIRQLAAVKLERFLDPGAVRSGLVEHYQAPPENYAFEDSTLYESHRGVVRFIRRLLNPLLKLFFNPNTIVHVLHQQGHINTFLMRHNTLTYELLNNLVVELTRLSIENRNLRMHLESFSGRLAFAERRARALEDVVQYKPGVVAPGVGPGKDGKDHEDETGETNDPNQRVPRRRRRRGRRSGGSQGQQGQPAVQSGAGSPEGQQRGDGGADTREPRDGGPNEP